MQPRILLADDHSMTRKGIKLLCQLDLGFTEVAEVGNCNELMKELGENQYTHLVLDINLSDGISLTVLPKIRSLYPDLKISILTMQSTAIYGKILKQLYGISYFISKATPEEDAIRMLRQFLQNEEPDTDSFVVKDLDNPFSDMGPRQLEVLHYVLKGLGTKEIAGILDLNMNTISTTKNRIFEKTMTSNLKELIELATLYKVN